MGAGRVPSVARGRVDYEWEAGVQSFHVWYFTGRRSELEFSTTADYRLWEADGAADDKVQNWIGLGPGA